MVAFFKDETCLPSEYFLQYCEDLQYKSDVTVGAVAKRLSFVMCHGRVRSTHGINICIAYMQIVLGPM